VRSGGRLWGNKSHPKAAEIAFADLAGKRTTEGNLRLAEIHRDARVDLKSGGRGNLTVGQLAKIADSLGTRLEVRFPVVERERPRLLQAGNQRGKF
jgi:hypothetical protein